MVSIYLHNSKLILTRKKQSMQASTKQIKHSQLAHTISSQKVGSNKGSDCQGKSSVQGWCLALNPDIESQGEARWKVSEDKTSQLLSLAWESSRQECVGSESGNPSTHLKLTQLYNCTRSWVCICNASTQWCEQSRWHTEWWGIDCISLPSTNCHFT